MFRIRKFEIKYINENGKCIDKDLHKFTTMPICKEEKNVFKTVEKYIKDENNTGYIKKIIIISTNKGKFYY